MMGTSVEVSRYSKYLHYYPMVHNSVLYGYDTVPAEIGRVLDIKRPQKRRYVDEQGLIGWMHAWTDPVIHDHTCQ